MKFGSLTHGLGDTLLLTAVCKYFPNQCTVQLPNNSKFKILFDNLANVELCEESNIQPIVEIGGGHYSTRKLRHFFGEVADTMNNRPLVLHSNFESEKWAHNFLKDKNNPIIFAPNCSRQWDSVRSLPHSLVESSLDSIKKSGYTPIICQLSSNYRKIEGIELVDLDLTKYISLLRQCGFYIGANTGDEHLAAAVGCKTIVYQPESSDKFNNYEWNYNHPSSLYFNFPK